MANRQNVILPNQAEILAKQYGVSSRTIERDGQFATAVEEHKSLLPDCYRIVLSQQKNSLKMP